MSVFVIISHIDVAGHGDSTSYPVLEQFGTNGWDFKGWFPAFEKKEDAEAFIKQWAYTGDITKQFKINELSIAELELK